MLIGDKRFLITICREHDVLPKVEVYRALGNVDIEVLLSDSIQYDPTAMLGRILVHCDSIDDTGYYTASKTLAEHPIAYVFESDLINDSPLKNIKPHCPGILQIPGLLNQKIYTKLAANDFVRFYDSVLFCYPKFFTEKQQYKDFLVCLRSHMEKQQNPLILLLAYDIVTLIIEDLSYSSSFPSMLGDFLITQEHLFQKAKEAAILADDLLSNAIAERILKRDRLPSPPSPAQPLKKETDLTPKELKFN